jgi:Na+/phosphate symporter
MIMGSNIGTSITNGIASLGFIGNKEEFKKAFAASTVLDLFNLIAVLIFLPLVHHGRSSGPQKVGFMRPVPKVNCKSTDRV